MKTRYLLIIIFFVCCVLSSAVLSQSRQLNKNELKGNVKVLNDIKQQQVKSNRIFERDLSYQATKVNNIFYNIESAFAEKNIETLISYLSVQTYLNLPNGTNGYYSSNQAYFILDDF